MEKMKKTAIFFYENGSRGRDVLTDFLGDAELRVLCPTDTMLMYLSAMS